MALLAGLLRVLCTPLPHIRPIIITVFILTLTLIHTLRLRSASPRCNICTTCTLRIHTLIHRPQPLLTVHLRPSVTLHFPHGLSSISHLSSLNLRTTCLRFRRDTRHIQFPTRIRYQACRIRVVLSKIILLGPYVTVA